MINRGWKLEIVACFLSIALACGPALAAEKPAKPIKIGVLFIMSGPMGGYGKHGTQAVQLALDEINAKGGVLGRKVEAIFEDDKMKPEVGVEIVNKFIKKDKVDFIMGPTSSAIAAVLADCGPGTEEDPHPHSGSGQLSDRCQIQPLPIQHAE